MTALLMLARLLGVVQIGLGLALWLGWLPHAVATHTALGSLLVLVLWMVALISLFALSSRVVPLVALFWGGVVLWLGMAQTTLLPGGGHWAIRVAHLMVGLAALGLIESLAKATRRHWVARTAATALLFAVGIDSVEAQTPKCVERPRHPITMIDVPGSPFQALPSADGCWIFVSLARPTAEASSGIGVLRRSGGTVTLTRVQSVDGNPAGMTITHDGRTLIVASGPRIAFISTAKLIAGDTGAVLGYLDEGATPGRIYANTTRDDKIAFVADERARTVSVIDLPKALATKFNASSIIGKIPTGNAPIAVTLSSDDNVMYVSSQAAPPELHWPIACKGEGSADTTAVVPQGAIHVVDVGRARTDPAHAVVASVPAGCSVVRLVLSPSGDRVYATARNSNALMVFDSKKLRDDPQHALIGRVPVGIAPVGVAVIDSGRKVIVTNSNRFAGTNADRQTLTVVDATRIAEAERAIIGSIPAGAFPREMRETSDGTTLVVTNFASKQIELIDLTRLPVEFAKR
jgi:DNA-binding beta-propeller fold protein YncE